MTNARDAHDTRHVLYRRAGRCLWLTGAAIIALLTLTPSGQVVVHGPMCLICGDLGGVDTVLNVLLYMPLGMGLAMAGTRPARALPLMCATSTVIECLQWFVIPGRDGTPGDVLTNSLGGALGFLIGAHVETLLVPGAVTAAWLTSCWLGIWILTQSAASYTLSARPTESRYYGQLARALGGHPAYPGRILSATLAGSRIPDWDFPSRRAFLALRADSGATIDVLVEARTLTQQLSPIARIADEEGREIVDLAADGTSLVYGVRTGAAPLRLRPAVYALANALDHLRETSSRGLPDTLRLRGRYAPPLASLSATSSNGHEIEGVVRITSAGAWRVISPMSTYATGTPLDDALDAGWLFALLLPAGYWLGSFRTCAKRDASRTWHWLLGAGSLLALMAGFAVGPLWFHMAAPTWWEIAGAVAGLAAGALAARTLRRRLMATQHP